MSIVFDPLTIFFLIATVVITVFCAFKGFAGVLVFFLKVFGCYALALALCKPLGALLDGIPPFHGMIYGPMYGWLSTFNNGALQIKAAESTPAVIANLVKNNAFLYYITDSLGLFVNPADMGDMLISEFVADYLTKAIWIFLSLIILFFLIRFAFRLLKNLAEKINDLAFVGPVNRVLGVVTGLGMSFVGAFTICIFFFFVLSIASSNEFIVGFISDTLFGGLHNASNSSLSQWIMGLASSFM